MSAGEFKELVRRTFHLKLTATEVGALFEFFNAQNKEVLYVLCTSRMCMFFCLLECSHYRLWC